MEFLEADQLWAEILRSYNQKPKGWQFLMARNPSGFYDGLISSSDSLWQLKLDTLYRPNPILIGARLTEEPGRFRNPMPFSYGFREMKLPAALSLPYGRVTAAEAQSELSRLIEATIRSEPKPISHGTQLHGSIIHLNRPLQPISDGQKDISQRMDSEIRRIMRNRYPGYG